jgi:hypothetical protein
MPEDWKAYLTAARRKCEVSDYFARRLAAVLRDVDHHSELPPIPVQAYFEGVVIASMAAVDQIAQAVNKALRLRLSPDRLVGQAFEKLVALVPDLKPWFDETLGVDLRRIRTRIIHYSYVKSPDAKSPPRWRVESAGTSYSGSRELLDYAAAAAEYAARLRGLTDTIERGLSDVPEPSRA